jgi:predicted lipoprotein
LASASPANAAAAERALGVLEAVIGNEVAPALDVSLGFSDADGD